MLLAYLSGWREFVMEMVVTNYAQGSLIFDALDCFGDAFQMRGTGLAPASHALFNCLGIYARSNRANNALTACGGTVYNKK